MLKLSLGMTPCRAHILYPVTMLLLSKLCVYMPYFTNCKSHITLTVNALKAKVLPRIKELAGASVTP